jgi:hypothetical protein
VRFVIVQGSPVPAQLAPVLERILRESGAQLQSAYRGPDATTLLHRLGKHTQTELYDGYVHHREGFLPANPPGMSTHELRSDAVAYRGPVGRKLVWWQVGLDVDNAHVEAFIRSAARHGWVVHRPYPVGVEFHHLNFVKPPLSKRVKAHARAMLGHMRAM